MRQLGANEQGIHQFHQQKSHWKGKYICLGEVNQQQFVIGVQRAIPPAELDELLHFDIIPAHLLEDANRLPSLQASSTNLRQPAPYSHDDLVSDNQLRQVANEASKRNWTKLAVNLDFLEYDIESYKAQNNYDAISTVKKVLFISLIDKFYWKIVLVIRITSNMARTTRSISDKKSFESYSETK